MSERLSLNLGIVAAIIVALLMIALSEHAVADTTCPAGTQPATAADIATMQAAGIPNAAVGVCWNPNNQYIGQATAQAKQTLAGMVCSSGVNIQNLDANFAVCAAKFMTALRQVSPGACINSGYRSPAQQLTACLGICGASSCPGKCAPPGQSFHQRGLAIDVTFNISTSQAWQIATASTNGGIANPAGLHSSDPKHFQATGSACSGAPVPASDSTDVYTGTQTGPSQTLSPSNLQAPQGYCMTSSNPIVYTPCATNGAQPVAQPLAVQQPLVTTPTILPTSSLATTTTTTNNISNLFQTTPIAMFPTATSAMQAISILTNLGSTTANGTASLNQNLNTIVTDIIAGYPTSTSQGSVSDQQQVSYPQDTFQTGSQQYTSSSPSGLDQLFQSLKSVLGSLLTFIQSL